MAAALAVGPELSMPTISLRHQLLNEIDESYL